MRRNIAVIFFTILMVMTLAGCEAKVVDVTVTIKNSTEYELETISFLIPPKQGTTSPTHDLLTAQDETLKPNEEREFTTSIFERDLGAQGWPVIFVKGDETKYGESISISLKDGKNSFDITCDSDMHFSVTAIEN